MIEDCKAFLSTGSVKGMIINADPKGGTVTQTEYSLQGFSIANRAAGMRVNDREVLAAHKFSQEIAVGTVPANSTLGFFVTTPSGIALDQYGDVINSAIITYSVPSGLSWTTSIKLGTYDTIVLHVTNTTGAAINVGTRNFRFNITAA